MDPASARYMIRINGHLGPTLLSAFPALASRRQGPDTVLTGALDKSGLHGVLAEVEALGLELLEVRQLASETSSAEDSYRVERLLAARAHLAAADPVLAQIIAARPDFDPSAWLARLPPMDLFGAIIFQVIGQQLSVAATRLIVGRVRALFDGDLPAPAQLLAADPAHLRAAGLSWRKIATIRELAARFADGRLDPVALAALPDDQVIAALTEIPGIGPWTAQGALILALDRQDVVLPGDLALRKAVRAAYQLDHLPTEQELLAIAEKWRPYRSLATGYLFSAPPQSP
jgi:DNA-3-methyladenine glycosylase II